MNKRQKIVQEAFLDNEEVVIKRLKQVYNQSLKDITAKAKALQDQINTLDALEGMTSDPEELARLKSMKQAKVYQKGYQDALKKQVNSILDNMQVEEFKTVSEYLNKCYEEGFLGTMYDLHGQGIPLCFPMDQESMVRAVQLDSKIKKGLYERLGEDVDQLKKTITSEVSRGISTGANFSQVALQIKAKMTGIYDKKSGGALYRAETIARTEGHRIQVQSSMDACYKAKEKGADVVKQWDSTLDGATRPSHQKVDGEIKELDEKFSNGLMFPGDPAGGAAEVCNCRCALLQRAKWALDKDELETLKERSEYFGIDKNDSFEDFKKKYLNAVEKSVIRSTIKDKLDDIDVKSIHDYMSSKSYIVNEKLRNETPLNKEEKEFTEHLDVALDKMPSYEGNLQRSLIFYSDDDVSEFMKDYIIGNRITFKEYLSTTKGETYNPEGQVQMFIEDAKSGKDISSLNEAENEVLYKRDSSFVVKNVVEHDGVNYILLGEDNE